MSTRKLTKQERLLMWLLRRIENRLEDISEREWLKRGDMI